MEKYKILNIIGDGTYGSVWKGLSLENSETVAIKKLKNKIKSWQECLEMKEIKALSKLKNHQNIIKLKEVIRENSGEVYMIFEYAEMNLYNLIEKSRNSNTNITEDKIKNIIYQIANGLCHAHSNGYFHRDLKPENILFVKGVVKIADFGLARELPNYYNNHALTEYVCTRWYRAPECILSSNNYSWMIDVWSLGCIMCELYMLKPIFPGTSKFDQLNKIVEVLGTPKFNDWPDGYRLIQNLNMKFPIINSNNLGSLIPQASDGAISLLSDILNFDPLRRPNCMKIMKHYFFSNINVDYNNNNGAVYENFHNQISNNFRNDTVEYNNEPFYHNFNFNRNEVNKNNSGGMNFKPLKIDTYKNLNLINLNEENNFGIQNVFTKENGLNNYKYDKNFKESFFSNYNNFNYNYNSNKQPFKIEYINNLDKNLSNQNSGLNNLYSEKISKINNNDFNKNIYEKINNMNNNCSKISNYAENHIKFNLHHKIKDYNNSTLLKNQNFLINNTWNNYENKNELNPNFNLKINGYDALNGNNKINDIENQLSQINQNFKNDLEKDKYMRY